MDSALILRLAMEKGESLSETEIDGLLNQSLLVAKLTRDNSSERLANIFKLVGLSEISGSQRLRGTQQIVKFINQEVATSEGFAYTGDLGGIVPCYNAMLLEAYVRLGMAQSPEVVRGLNWIKKYQLFERNQTSSWQGKGICLHGGCLKATPCYIGVGKTLRALLTYQEYTANRDGEVANLIAKGLNYMLDHQLFLRRSTNQPISPHITDMMFPQSYCLSLMDLVYIVGKSNSQKDPRAQALMTLLAKKDLGNRQWKIDYIYRYKGYLAFDNRRGPSPWVSELSNIWLGVGASK